MDEVAGARRPAAQVTRVPVHVLPGNLGEPPDRGPRPHRVHRRLLGAEHQRVEGTLPGRERAGHWNGPGEVRGVVAELGAHIHDDQLTCLCLTPVLIVVQDGSVDAGADDARIPEPLGASPAERGFRRRLDLVLPGPRLRLAHRGEVPRGGNVHGAPQAAQLVRVFDEPECPQGRKQVPAPLALPFVLEGGQEGVSPVAGGVAAPEFSLGTQQRSDDGRRRVGWVNSFCRDARQQSGLLARSQHRTGPALGLRVSARQEEMRLPGRPGTGYQNDQRAVGLESGEIEEIVVLTKGRVLGILGIGRIG